MVLLVTSRPGASAPATRQYNGCVKIAFILIGILCAALAWRFGLPGRWRTQGARAGRPVPRLQRLLHSLAAGVAVYFTLMALAMVWLGLQAGT